jgi:hypothetical protein
VESEFGPEGVLDPGTATMYVPETVPEGYIVCIVVSWVTCACVCLEVCHPIVAVLAIEKDTGIVEDSAAGTVFTSSRSSALSAVVTPWAGSVDST